MKCFIYITFWRIGYILLFYSCYNERGLGACFHSAYVRYVQLTEDRRYEPITVLERRRVFVHALMTHKILHYIIFFKEERHDLRVFNRGV